MQVLSIAEVRTKRHARRKGALFWRMSRLVLPGDEASARFCCRGLSFMTGNLRLICSLRDSGACLFGLAEAPLLAI